MTFFRKCWWKAGHHNSEYIIIVSEIQSDKNTLIMMCHYNINFRLATVKGLVVQDLSSLASIQLAWLQLLQSVCLRSLSLAAFLSQFKDRTLGKLAPSSTVNPATPRNSANPTLLWATLESYGHKVHAHKCDHMVLFHLDWFVEELRMGSWPWTCTESTGIHCDLCNIGDEIQGKDLLCTNRVHLHKKHLILTSAFVNSAFP